MKTLSAAEFARNIEHWLADLEYDGEPLLIQGPHGRQMVAIPAAWWCPADPPPSADPGAEEWTPDADGA
ncbi:hypothetical protein [Azospirillum sp.]|uniref:hypothetical protein n=1 Tax=Azospirillum sp. TaxID=34012 RepID=UPI002D2B207A|nr:hypothetical protein [Azospirillum sp.]HYD66857.1 hypothetical protein [Azospirillum sp.]